MAAEKHNQVLFKVLRDATKPEIKAAVELMFKVDGRFGADRASTRARPSASARSIGRRDHVKKAYVCARSGPGAELLRGGRVMPVIKVKPTSPGRRAVVKVTHPHLYKGRPEASLLEPQMQNAGRNNNGHITTRHKGGGHKHHYRVVDFVRNKDAIPAKVERIEYDPNRSAHIALVVLRRRRAPLRDRAARPRSRLARSCPAPRRRSRPATRCRSATSRSARSSTASRCCPARARRSRARPAPPCTLLAREGTYAQVRLRSGEVRKIHIDCRATIGEVSQRRAQPAPLRQGRRQALEGHPPDGARRRDEPGRPPARRRRRPHRRGPGPGRRRGTR